MQRFYTALAAFVFSFIFTVSLASATHLYFDPTDQIYNVGDTLAYDLYADIDIEDAIMGFGFDLSFDGGTTYISTPGDSGSYLTFDSFTGNSSLFTYFAAFDDGDTISGWRTLFEADVSGSGILLGTFEFIANDLGIETITLGANDLGMSGAEGLVRGFTATNPGGAFMPNILTATASPVPEPGTILLFTTGLAGFVGFRKRFRI